MGFRNITQLPCEVKYNYCVPQPDLSAGDTVLNKSDAEPPAPFHQMRALPGRCHISRTPIHDAT